MFAIVALYLLINGWSKLFVCLKALFLASIQGLIDWLIHSFICVFLPHLDLLVVIKAFD